MRIQRYWILFLILALVLPGIGTHRAIAADDKTLVIGITEDTTSLDPARGFETMTTIVHKAVYDTLVTFPPDNVDKIIPNLATAWKISDDGKTYTFTLADGVMFSSGNPMTAADAVFSFNRTMHIKGNPSFLAETIDSVSASDPKTFVLKLKAPDPAILAKLIFGAFAVTDSKTIKAQGGTDAADADKSDQAEKWLNQNSAGTGPYILTKWEKNNQTVLVKNPKYRGKARALDQVILRDMPQAATQKAALEAGDVDIANDLSNDQVASVKSNADLKIFEGLSSTLIFLKFNNKKDVGGPVSDAKVQKAIRLALDYEGIAKLAGGAALTPPSVIPVGFAGALGKDKALKRDVAGAKKLLADAGQGSGFSADLAYPDITFAGVNFGTLAQKVQADLKDVSITVNLKPGDLTTALAKYRDGSESFGLWLWNPDYWDAMDYVEFLPGTTVGKRAGWTDDNGDAEIKDLRDKVKVEVDAAKRADMFAKIQLYLQDKGPFAPLVQPGTQVGYRANLKGFAYNPLWRLDPATFSK
jgi:peptide/nickel transport system substrate-binding protein